MNDKNDRRSSAKNTNEQRKSGDAPAEPERIRRKEAQMRDVLESDHTTE